LLQNSLFITLTKYSKMKKLNFGLALIVGLLFVGVISCTKDGQVLKQQENRFMNEGISILDVDEYHDLYTQLMSANEDRLKSSGISSRSCMNIVNVPGDVLSIQAAVDAVCPGGAISVTSGTYTENVVVNKPGITITGSGEMQLIGSFTLNSDANDVTIRDFHFFTTGRPAIFAVGVNGGNILNNTFTGNPSNGLSRGTQYHTSNNVTISGNYIHGLELGIGFLTGGFFGEGECRNNEIKDNTLTNMYVRGGIILQANCDNNTIQNNSITDSPEQLFNAGITLISFGGTTGETCDDNKIRQNTSNKNLRGIWIVLSGESNGGSSNNMVGSGNVCNGNKFYGIQISDANGNRIINNSASNNGFCDIIQERGKNNFRANTAECTEGF